MKTVSELNSLSVQVVAAVLEHKLSNPFSEAMALEFALR